MKKKFELPIWANGIIAISVLGGAVFGIFKAIKYFNNLKKFENATIELDETDKQIKQIVAKNKTIRQTLTDAQLTQLANKLQTSFDGYGTDFSNIYNVFIKLRNEIDLLRLRQVYGIREISSGKFNIADNFKGTLDQTLVDELKLADITKLNKLLTSKKIFIQI